jgi:sugar phosphate isomerase/epimerase
MIGIPPSAAKLTIGSAASQRALDILRSRAESHGLTILEAAGGGDYTLPDVSAEVAKTVLHLDILKRLGGRYLRIFAGWIDPKLATASTYRRVNVALRRIAQEAHMRDLNVIVENHGGITRTAEQINRLFRGIREENIGLNFDAANFFMYGVDPQRALARLRVPILFIHCKNVKETEGKKVYCRLDEGLVDYPALLRELIKKRGYRGPLCLEYENPSDAEAGTLEDKGTLLGWFRFL